MSVQDRTFLERSGLSAAKIAQLVGKSRQAVSKGIGGEEDYFSSSDLVRIADKVDDKFPGATDSVQAAVSDIFHGLAEQIGRRNAVAAGVATAVSQAERLWLILPEYTVSFSEQSDDYINLFGAIDGRRPGAEGEHPLEVIVFCHKGRESIEMQFDESWYQQRQLALIQCEVVDKMSIPMVIADPHRHEGRACYALAANGFEPLAPGLARSRVLEFAGHVTEKLRASAKPNQGKPLNLLTATPFSLIEAGIERL